MYITICDLPADLQDLLARRYHAVIEHLPLSGDRWHSARIWLDGQHVETAVYDPTEGQCAVTFFARREGERDTTVSAIVLGPTQPPQEAIHHRVEYAHHIRASEISVYHYRTQEA